MPSGGGIAVAGDLLAWVGGQGWKQREPCLETCHLSGKERGWQDCFSGVCTGFYYPVRSVWGKHMCVLVWRRKQGWLARAALGRMPAAAPCQPGWQVAACSGRRWPPKCATLLYCCAVAGLPCNAGPWAEPGVVHRRRRPHKGLCCRHPRPRRVPLHTCWQPGAAGRGGRPRAGGGGRRHAPVLGHQQVREGESACAGGLKDSTDACPAAPLLLAVLLVVLRPLTTPSLVCPVQADATAALDFCPPAGCRG